MELTEVKYPGYAKNSMLFCVSRLERPRTNSIGDAHDNPTGAALNGPLAVDGETEGTLYVNAAAVEATPNSLNAVEVVMLLLQFPLP